MPIKVNLPDGRIVNFPDGMPQGDIEKAIGDLNATATPMAAHSAAPERTWTDTAVDALPTLGGAAGGIIGGLGGTVAGMGVGGVPGAVGGAALGGAAGEAARQLVNRARGASAPGTMTDAATGIGTQGAIQGAAELAGAGLGKGLQVAGKGLYKIALRPSAAVSREFGDVVGRGLEEGLAVPSGAAKTGRLITASADSADALLANAQAAGAPRVATNDVVRGGGFADLGTKYAKRASLGMADETGTIADRAAAMHKNFPGGIELTDAQGLKRVAQDASDTAFRAQERGGVIKTVGDELSKAQATGLRQGIEDIVPAVGPINARTRSLMGLSDAMETAGFRNHVTERVLMPLASGVGTGVTTGDWQKGAGAAALTAALTAPGGLSRAGILLDRAGGSGMSSQAIRAALMALMTREGDAK